MGPNPLNTRDLLDELEKYLSKENASRPVVGNEAECKYITMRCLLQDAIEYCEWHDHSAYLEMLHLIIGRIRVSKHIVAASQHRPEREPQK